MGALLQIFRLFWIPKISPLKSIHLKKILAKFSYPKKSQNQKLQPQTKCGFTLLAELCGRDMGALLQIFRLFWIPKISPLKSIHLKKILAKFSYPKKSQNQKFQTQKIPRQEPMHLWNPSLPKITCLISSFAVLWGVLCHSANCLGGGGGLPNERGRRPT